MKWLLDLIYPRRAVCMGCGSMLGCERDDICDECRERMARSWVGVRPSEKKSSLDGMAFAYGYQGVAGNVVRKMKYASVRVLAEEMGADVAKAAGLLRIDGLDMVVPTPMHVKRRRQRGYNQSELLARFAAQRLDVPCENALLRVRNTVQQVRLRDEARRRNLDGAFAVRSEFKERMRGATVLLIDDVYTTGTTATQCALAMRAAGVKKVYFAAYAVSTPGKKRRK